MWRLERVIPMSSEMEQEGGSKSQKALKFFQYGNDAAMKANL